MGCNCGGKNKDVQYAVTFKDGSRQVFNTTAEAQAAIRKARGGMLRAIKAGT